MSVTFGIHLGHADPGGGHALDHHVRLLDIADQSEHVTHVWAADHFQENDQIVLESWTRLSYLAAAYPRLAVGHFVMSQSYRNPALVAKMAATLAYLSRGRYTLGIGAGWLADEYRAYGYDFPPAPVRLEQLEEAILVLRAMWGPQPATFAGRHYRVSDAYCVPRPDKPITILVGTDGRRALRIVAEHADAWNWDAPMDAYRRPYEILRRHCLEIGRDMTEILLTAGTEIHLPADERDFNPGVMRYGDPQVLGPHPNAVIDELRPLVDLGVRHFQVYVNDTTSMHRLCDEVAPQLAKLA